MAVLKKLTGAGDETLATWDPAKVSDDWRTDAALREAERIIDTARRAGNFVAVGHPNTDQPAERFDRFDPKTQEEILILPRMAGGC